MKTQILVKFSNDDKDILVNSDLIVQLGMLSDEKISKVKEKPNIYWGFKPL